MSSLTALPEEILRKVLRWATLPHAHYPFFDSGSQWPQLPPLDRHSLQLKLTLALISRQFNRISSEFLYETLHFSSTASLKSLTAAARRNPDIVSALAQRTYHISLLTRIKRWIPDSELASLTDDITFLLSSCIQLRAISLEISKILHIERTAGWKKCHDRIFSALPAERLQHFEWPFAAPGADCSDNKDPFSNFLRRASNLQVLYCGSLASPSSSALAATPISLPSLTHLRITADPRSDFILPGLEHLPSLTHLSTTLSTTALASSPFWSTPKPSLTSLTLQRTLDRTALSKLLAISPKLDEITYFYFDGAPNSINTWENIHHPTLSTLNIQLFAPYCESIVQKAASSSHPETRREKWEHFKNHLPISNNNNNKDSSEFDLFESELGLPMLSKLTIGDFASSSWTIEDVREDLEFATSRLRQEGVQVTFR